MSMYLIKSFLVMIVIFSFSFFIGNIICKKEKNIFKSLIYGFTVIVTIFELISIPAIIIKCNFSILALIYSAVIIIIFLLSLFIFTKKKEYKKYKIKKISNNVIGKIILISLILIQMIASVYLDHRDDDDGYYVTISNIAIEKDEICLEGNSVYNGTKGIVTSVRPEFAGWELFIAYISELFNEHPAVMCHTILPVTLICLCYMVLYEIGRKIFKEDSDIIKFVILVAILNIFSGYSVHSSGAFLIFRIWQGKAMLVNFAMPMLILNCLDIYKEKDRLVTWIMNFCIVFMGTGLTVVGVYLMPMLYFIIGAPLLIKFLFEKNYKQLLSRLKNAIISMIPSIVLLFYILISVMNSDVGQTYTKRNPPDWLNLFNMIFVNKTIFVLLIISIIIISIKGNMISKLIFVLSPIILFSTFLNPLFSGIISTKITGVDVYWRVYWLIPTFIIISYAFVLFTNESEKKFQNIVFMVICLMIAFSGEFIYSRENFNKATNPYKIPDEIPVIAEKIPRGSKCMFPDNLSFYIRQYTSEISVLKARSTSVTFSNIEDTEYSYSWLYDQIYTYGLVDEPVIKKLLEKTDVDYIYFSDISKIKDIKSEIIKIDENSGMVRID